MYVRFSFLLGYESEGFKVRVFVKHVATVVGKTSGGYRRGVLRRRSVHSPAVKKKKGFNIFFSFSFLCV